MERIVDRASGLTFWFLLILLVGKLTRQISISWWLIAALLFLLLGLFFVEGFVKGYLKSKSRSEKSSQNLKGNRDGK